MAERTDFNDHKCLAMEPSKRERVLKAAIAEFRTGFKNASTDRIAMDAGVSKGLLFHYFNTKEGLYRYTLWFALDVYVGQYIDQIDLAQSDVMERLWQAFRLKSEMTRRYPFLPDFLDHAYIKRSGCSDTDFINAFADVKRRLKADILHNIDRSLFKDGVNPEMAAEILFWAAEGFAKKMGGFDGSGYLERLAEYMYIMRIGFYKDSSQ